MSEKVRKYRLIIFSSDKKLLFCKSFYSIKDAHIYYAKHLNTKYPKDKFIVIFDSYITCE